MQQFIEYIPIFTTIFSIFFFIRISKHYQKRKTNYLWWWSFGALTFGLGTLSESINVILGFSEANFKFWYIVGALLGGFPLAQGSVYLLMPTKFANITSKIFVAIIVIASISVLLSPIHLPEEFAGKLSGNILGWKWTRFFSPIINIYAFIFLVGGAIFSAYRYA